MKNYGKHDLQHFPKIFPLAVAVGMLVFFITGEIHGGLSAVAGFFVGILATIVLCAIVGASVILLDHLAGDTNINLEHINIIGGAGIQALVKKQSNSKETPIIIEGIETGSGTNNISVTKSEKGDFITIRIQLKDVSTAI